MKTTTYLFVSIALLLRASDAGTAEPAFTQITTGDVAADTGQFAGHAWADFRGRGLLDLVICNYGDRSNVYYRNNGNGTFTKVTEGVLVEDFGAFVGPAAADLDNDGAIDLLVSAGVSASSPERNRLYRNNGDGTFTAISGGVVTNIAGFYIISSVVDYDNDGFIDLFIPTYGGQSLLFRNNGDATFRRIATGGLGNSTANASSAAWADYDNDGFMDVAIQQAGPRMLLFRNNRDGTFARITANILTTDDWPRGSWGAAWGDYDNDGHLDIFVPGMEGGNRLYRNTGNGNFERVASAPMLPRPGSSGSGSRCSAWGDFDNDGDLDLFVGNANTENRLYRNEGDGTFTELPEAAPSQGAGAGIQSQSTSWADYDHDGFLDLFVTQWPGSNLLYHNEGNSNAWLEVKLVGTVANRSAVGARVHVQANIGGKTLTQMREITSSGGRSVQPLVAHFGLGNATNIERIRIVWPSGTVQELANQAPRQILTVTEPSRLAIAVTNGSPQLLLRGGRGLRYEIQSSSDLASWSAVTNVAIAEVNGAATVPLDAPATERARFFRARSQ